MSLIPSWSDPMQLPSFREDVCHDFLTFSACPSLVHLGCGNPDIRAERVNFPLATEKITRRSDVGSMRPRPPLIFAKGTEGYGDRCGYHNYDQFLKSVYLIAHVVRPRWEVPTIAV